MVRRGYSVWVLAMQKVVRGGASSLERDFVAAGAEVVYLNTFFLGDIGRWFRWFSLVGLLKRLRPDILHSHLPRADLATCRSADSSL